MSPPDRYLLIGRRRPGGRLRAVVEGWPAVQGWRFRLALAGWSVVVRRLA